MLVGAGLAGSLLTVFLARLGYNVQVVESRADSRRVGYKGGRSINLALSHRGIRALRAVGLAEAVLAESVPMRGRMMHSPTGQLTFLPYSQRADEYINSISRARLNEILLSAAEKERGVSIHFQEACTKADFAAGKVWTTCPENDTIEWQADVILGTDGANSAIRKAMHTACGNSFTEHTEWESHGYKELAILPDTGGNFRMEKNALHIWARQTYMMIALPNFDGTFTCTLFMPLEGENSFAELQNQQAVEAFFAEHFADVLPLMPDLYEQWQQNPIGHLGTLRCSTYVYDERAALLGDAAHAVVPFYGQGMNASFEDCLCLYEALQTHQHDWRKALQQYNNQRHPNSHAIATLAQENFVEMRDHVANPIFVRKRRLELALEQLYPDYFSKYALVTFHPEVPYTEAHRRGNAQDALLMSLCADVQPEAQDYERIYQALQKI